MTHDELRDLAPLHASGALDGDDLAQFSAHLAACAPCRRLAAEHAEAAAGLALALPPELPSQGLRERVLAGTRPRPVLPGPGIALRNLRWTAAAALLMAALAGWYALEEGKRADRLANDVRHLQEQVRAEAEFAKTCEKLALKGTPDMAPGAAGLVMWKDRELSFTAAGLPQLPRDREYELWAVIGDRKMRAGQAAPDEHGHVTWRMAMAAPMEKVDLWAVTDEPKGGMDQPTGKFYLLSAK